MGVQYGSSGRPWTAGAAGVERSRYPGDNPQVKALRCRSAFHDPSATIGREMMGHTGLTTGLGVIGEALEPAASMIFGQAGTAPHDIKAILLATLGR